MAHDAHCDCGCNEHEQEEMTVTLTLDDDTEVECVVLTIFTAGERDYIALLPMDGQEAEEGEVFLYRYTEEDGQPNLENIEDDDEYEIVADAFDELLDEQEYDELIGEDELEEEEEVLLQPDKTAQEKPGQSSFLRILLRLFECLINGFIR